MHRQRQVYAGAKASSTRSHSFARSFFLNDSSDSSKACDVVEGPRPSGVKSKLERNDSSTRGRTKRSLPMRRP